MSSIGHERSEGDTAGLFPVLDKLEPLEFLALYRTCIRSAGSYAVDSPALMEFSSQRKLDMEYQVDEYLCTLPRRSLDRSIPVYETFASSPRTTDRVEIAANGLPSLTPADHALGMSLWDRLIRDPDWDVRFEAQHELFDSHGFLGADNERLYSLGLTRLDGEQLANAYRQAERGENLHDPLRYAGELALKKFTQHLDAPDQPL